MLNKIIFTLILSLIVFSLDVSAGTTQSSCKSTWNQIQNNYDLDPLYESLEGLCGTEFREELLKKIATNQYFDYRDARKFMFSTLDNVRGQVCGVYSGTCIKTASIPDAKYYNTEHSWCQSWGAVGTAKSDLHHLFPVKSTINSKRNNYPFCEVSRASWSQYGSYFGKSYSGTTCFEPPNWHKGELARAMFYFAVRYSKTIDSEQEAFFREWSDSFPVTEKEHFRNEDIFYFQGNKNPFVQYPEFIKLIRDF